MENISSEQELKQLLEEGRITEEEFRELLDAMETKHRSGNQSNRPKYSRKQELIAAIIFTIVTAFLLWICLMYIDKPPLGNKPIVIGVSVICVIGSAIQALRYWFSYWTYKEISS